MKKIIPALILIATVICVTLVISCSDRSNEELPIEPPLPDHPLEDGKKDENGVFHGYAFADNITEHTGEENEYYSKEKALNGVRGKGDKSGSLDVFIVGDGTDKYATFEWKNKVIVNGEGDDFKIFENGFIIKTSGLMSMDLGTVQVSSDGTNWIDFPVIYTDQPAENSIEGKSGFLGLTPVYLNFDHQELIDPASNEAGGDGFDLSNVGIAEGDTIKYIRVRDGGNDYPDNQIESNGIDIDGVCAFHWKEKNDTENQ